MPNHCKVSLLGIVLFSGSHVALADSIAERVFKEVSHSYGGSRSGHRIMQTFIADLQVGDCLRYQSSAFGYERNDPRQAEAVFHFLKEASALTPKQRRELELVDAIERGEGSLGLNKQTISKAGVSGLLSIFGICGTYDGTKNYQILISWKNSRLSSLDSSRLDELADSLEIARPGRSLRDERYFRGKGNYWLITEVFQISGLKIEVSTTDGSKIDGSLSIASTGNATLNQVQAGVGTYILTFPEELEFIVSIKCERKTFGDIRKLLGASE